MKKQKNLKVSILGKSFFITTDEDTEDILQAAELLNALMQEKLNKNPSSNESKIALITALQIATDFKKSLKVFDHYKETAERLASLLKQSL